MKYPLRRQVEWCHHRIRLFKIVKIAFEYTLILKCWNKKHKYKKESYRNIKSAHDKTLKSQAGCKKMVWILERKNLQFFPSISCNTTHRSKICGVLINKRDNFRAWCQINPVIHLSFFILKIFSTLKKEEIYKNFEGIWNQFYCVK